MSSPSVTDAAWDGSASQYNDEQWVRACALDRADCDPKLKQATAKERYGVPYKGPDGTINRNGVHAAAQRFGQIQACGDAKRNAAKALISAYKALKEDPPDVLTEALGRSTFDVPEVRRAVVTVTEIEVRDAADGDGPSDLDADGDNDNDNGEAGDDSALTFRGHAAVYNKLSDDLGGFREVITRGAFDDILQSNADVRFLWNHNPDHVLARTASGTLQLASDDDGLHVTAQIAPTQMGRDLSTLIKRGDVSQMSFAFTVADNGDDWVEGGDGTTLRQVNKVGALYDVSAVTYPAYPQTDAQVRGVAHFGTEVATASPIKVSAPAEVTIEVVTSRSAVTARELRLRLIKRGIAPPRA